MVTSAKYVPQGLIFKTPNTVIVFSNVYLNTEALKEDCWKIYTIEDDDLNDKTASATKSRFNVIRAWNNYTMYDDWSWCNAIWLKMNKLCKYFQQKLKEISSQHLLVYAYEALKTLCYGSLLGSEHGFQHHLSTLDIKEQVQFCF